MAGSVFKRCGCVDPAGRAVWRTCPEIKRTGHGTWAYRLDLGAGVDADGVFRRRRQRYRSGYATKAAAETALAELRATLGQGSHVEPSRMPVGEYLEEWLAGKANLRPSTRSSYRQYLDRYFKPHLGHLELRRLRAADIEQMYAQIRLGNCRGRKRKQPVGPATLLRIHAALKSALNTAVRRKQLPYNPALGVELESVRRPSVTPYGVDELGRFLEAAGRHPLGALFELMALSGLRRGEAVGLRWQDVDLERGIVTVRQQVMRIDGRLQVGPPKTRSGESGASTSIWGRSLY